MSSPHRQADDPRDWVVIQRLVDGQQVPATAADIAQAAIVLHRRGMSVSAIAERLGQHQRQISRWICRQRKGVPLAAAGEPRHAETTLPLHLAPDAPTSSVRVARVPVDRLRFHPNNIRSDLGDLRQLTASIKAHGVLCPLMAHPCGSYLQLLHGHRRLAAARLAGLRSVPVLIADEHEDDEAITLMLAENLMRAGISRHDRRAAIRSLLDEHGHTATGIAARLGVTADTVRRWAANDEPTQRRTARRQRRVSGAAVLRVVEQWTDRAAAGLTAEQSRQLLADLSALGDAMTGARRYRSGHCGVGRHHACPHLCAGVLCSCACHQQPTDLMDGAAMATVLTVGNSEGARRCDAKCHEASEPDCDCVCGGRYHGKGSQGAMDLIQDDLRAGRFGAELAHLAGQLTAEALQDTLF